MEQRHGASPSDQENDVAGASTARLNSSPELAVDPASRPLVLLLENEPEEAAPIADILTYMGYRRIIARSEERARAELARENQTVAVLVADLNLSASEGLAFINEARSQPRYAALPIIITSGNGAAAALELARSLGRIDYLVKPFALADLLQCIRRWTQDED